MNLTEIEKGKRYWVLQDGKAKEVKIEEIEIKIGFYVGGWLGSTTCVKPEALFKTKQDLIDSL